MSRIANDSASTAANVAVDSFDDGLKNYVAKAVRRAGLKVSDSPSAPLVFALSGTRPEDELAKIEGELRTRQSVLCWGVHDKLEGQDLASSRASTEQWTLERLAQQRGALVSASLEAIVELLRLRCAGIAVSSAVAGPKPEDSSLAARLAQRLIALAPTVEPETQNELCIDIEDNEPVLRSGEAHVPLVSVETTAEALRLARCQVIPQAPSSDPVEIDRAELGRILKPPPRLLSEPTSKRLLRCFGVEFPSEILCRSPSEASRAAEQLGGEVVLKLARPELDNKLASGLVVLDAAGPTAIRKATADLLARGDELGPPASLGVLVCQRVDGGRRLWLQLDHHPRLGRLLLAGEGDVPTPAPKLALSVPFDGATAFRALHLSGIGASHAQFSAWAIALSRLSSAIDLLGSSISRLEIHPLVARDDHSSAQALDALVRLEIEARRDRPSRR